MGRKTFESLGKRALPNRKNIVISRNPSYCSPGVDIAHSVAEAINLVANQQRVFVIGGGQLYRSTLSIADEIYVTEITDQNPNLNLFPVFPGDTFFPELNEMEWRLDRPGKRWFVASNRLVPSKGLNVKRTGLYFRLQVFRRRGSNMRKKLVNSATLQAPRASAPKCDLGSDPVDNQLGLEF